MNTLKFAILSAILTVLMCTTVNGSKGCARIVEDVKVNYPKYEKIQKYLVHKIKNRKMNHTGERISVLLGEEEYEVTQENGTDTAEIGFTDNSEKGVYKCIVCDQSLFRSEGNPSIPTSHIWHLIFLLTPLDKFTKTDN